MRFLRTTVAVFIPSLCARLAVAHRVDAEDGSEQEDALVGESGSHPLGGKRGISGPDAGKHVKVLHKNHITWGHDTSVHGKGNVDNWKEGIHFAPMLWGKGNLDHEHHMVVKSTKMMLTFDNPGQQNLSPSHVASLWPKIEEVARTAGTKILVAPSVNWAQGAFGKPHEWYAEFFKHCGHCRVDGVALTVYTCDVGQMKDRVDALKQFKKDIYVTAFACADNPNECEADDGRVNTKWSKSWFWQCEYMKDVVPYLEDEPSIKGYAWDSRGEPGKPDGYMGESALVTAGGAVTPLGKCYFRIPRHRVVLGVGGKEVENHSPQMNHRHPPLRGFDPLKAGACKVHERVKCPHSGAYCDRESCCPDGTACPSSAAGWSKCPKGRTLDCTHWPWSKMGIAAESIVHKAELKALSRTNISWAADWTIHAQEHHVNFHHQDHVLYMPMYWGEKTKDIQSRDGPIWLGFNEPNDPNEANLDPLKAAKLWPKVEKAAALHSVHTLVGPSVSGNNPIHWYDKFMEACKGCRIDAVNMHVYSCSLEQMKRRIEEAKKYKKPIWVTEFACGDNPEQIPGNVHQHKSWHWQCQYMKAVIPYLNSEPSVAGYAWFSYGLPGKPDHYVGESGLLDQSRITPLGRCYSQLAGVRKR